MKHLIWVLAIFLGTSVSAQDNSFPSNPSNSNIIDELTTSIEGQGKVTMHMDQDLEDLIKLSKLVSEQNGSMGYTVQLFRGNNGQVSRRNAESIKSEYLKIDPQGQISVVYTNPNWRVHVGQFRTYSEALKLKMFVEKNMPEYKSQIYIVRVQLNFSKEL